MPCAAGVEGLLADEVHQLTGLTGNDLLTGRGGVMANASWRDALRLNLHSRLTQRVLIQLSQTFYRSEKDLYDAAFAVAWEIWFTTQQTFKIEALLVPRMQLPFGTSIILLAKKNERKVERI